MRILRFDSVGGASGDMILAALIDLGVDMQSIYQCMEALPVEKFEIRNTPFFDYGLKGIKAEVLVQKSSSQVHRHFNDIREIINNSGFSDKTKDLSLKVFKLIAQVEANIHNVSPDKIHFHEVGAMDSIIDILVSCAAFELLNIDEVLVSPLPVGMGSIKCDHGILPLPVPATQEILKNHPVIQTDESFEMVTPTGAALLMTWKSISKVSRNAFIVHSSNGFGNRALNKRPNLLRASIFETVDCDQSNSMDECTVLECNIDDTIPELLGSLSQKVIENGALDVFTTSVQMKKQRPGTLLTVLCKSEDKESLKDIIFKESTTFGIREYITSRTILERHYTEVNTPYGPVRIKIGSWKGKDITKTPEHDDCVKCAKANDVSIRTVYETAMQLAAATC